MPSKLNITQVLSFIEGKSFTDIKEVAVENGLFVKERKDLDDLYLLALDTSADTGSQLQQQCNGLIFEKDTNRLICANQNRMVELTEYGQLANTLKDFGYDDTIISSDNNKIRFEYCEDGTIIRLYNHNNRWYTATTRCMDARDSNWSSSKSFHDMFWETFDTMKFDADEFCSKLDANFTYIFILLHPENNIVVKHKEPSAVYVCSINNTTLEEDYRNIGDFRRSKIIPYVEPSKMKQNCHNWSKRGIICKIMTEDNYWLTYKMDFEEYSKRKLVRGNVPQIEVRYLELLDDTKKLHELEKYYPEHKFKFAVMRTSLMKLAKSIYQLYVDSHIKRNVTVEEDHIFFRSLKQLHGQYKATNKPITIKDVETKLFSYDRRLLVKLLGGQV